MSRTGLVRLFVAVDVPADARDALASWGREAARAVASLGEPPTPPAVRAIDPDSIHLTLCFLGARPAGDIDAFAGVLPACAAHAAELRVGAPVWLPRRHPRALAVTVAEEAQGSREPAKPPGTRVDSATGELERLHAELSEGLAAAADWEPERRRFRAHITVVRVRGNQRRRRDGRGGLDSDAITAAALPPTPRLAFVPETLTLYRSLLDPAGARYEPLASCRLLPAERD